MTTTLQPPTLMEQILNEIRELHKEVLSMSRKQVETDSKVSTIETALIGDGRYSDEGVIDTVKSNTVRITKCEMWQSRINWTIGIAASIGAGVAFVFKFIWDSVIKH